MNTVDKKVSFFGEALTVPLEGGFPKVKFNVLVITDPEGYCVSIIDTYSIQLVLKLIHPNLL